MYIFVSFLFKGTKLVINSKRVARASFSETRVKPKNPYQQNLVLQQLTFLRRL